MSGGGVGPEAREPQNRRVRLLWTRDLGIGMGHTGTRNGFNDTFVFTSFFFTSFQYIELLGHSLLFYAFPLSQ